MLNLPAAELFERPDILKALIPARAALAELKGVVRSIPNENILLSNLTLREAKDSSAVENIITTQDSLHKHQIQPPPQQAADREVHNYKEALLHGLQKMKSANGLSLNTILEIQKIIEPKRPGFRKVAGTVLKHSSTGRIVWTPPSPEQIPDLMNRLERFINEEPGAIDPIARMAVIHHWFETIHPFYDGNGGTGRIINILYLILKNLLDSPVLYLSRYIIHNKLRYYDLLQRVRENEDAWPDWILYMAEAVADTSRQATDLIKKISRLFLERKAFIRGKHKFYSQDLLNCIFSYPYTKTAFLEAALKVSRPTAARYLDELAASGVLEKRRLSRENYYINQKLFDLLKK